MNTVDVRRLEELTPPQEDWWAALWDRLYPPLAGYGRLPHSESHGRQDLANPERRREAPNPARLARTVARRSERASA